ncbi:hypothetical protein L208DRAFT_1313086 [Tricholoma matsutake]|nr:hypothetical protein L208DRAFT_1313086 [Tricholoma matsutake 945]
MLAPAKGWKRPKIILPDLPAELWMTIFREATWVSRILDSDSVEEFGSLTSRQRIRPLRASLITKRYLVRVCKQWYSLAIPFLYESIIIGRCRTLNTLRDALQSLCSPENLDAGNGHPLGWWTKRLDVAMRDNGSDTESELESLSQIIQSLPNLNILVFRVTTSKYHNVLLPGSFLHHLSRSAGSNLQAIVWYTRALTPDSPQWYAFLAGMPTIRTLSCSQFFDDLLPALPALRTFSLHDISSFPNPSLPNPSLRHLTFGVYKCDVNWKVFLLNHGQQLEVIQVHTIWKCWVSHVVQAISQSCPKLQRLDIAIQTWEELNSSQISLPATIHTFGLYCMQPQAPRTGYKQLFSALKDMKFGPAFKVIQLLRPNNVTDLYGRHRQLLLTNMPKLRELGFEIQDHEGQPLL